MQPDYRLMERAASVARELFPNAHEIRALWTPANAHSATCVEVLEAKGSGRVLSINVERRNAVSIRAAGTPVSREDAMALLPIASAAC